MTSNNLFKEYFQKESQCIAHLVRFLNQSTRYHEKKRADNFWTLIKKIDSDIQGVNERTDMLVEKLISEVNSLKLENKKLREELRKN